VSDGNEAWRGLQANAQILGASARHPAGDVPDARLKPLYAATASLNRSHTSPPVRNLRDGRPGHRYSGNESPNIGLPLLDCSCVASSWMTSQCSTRTPSSILRMSAAIKFAGAPSPENRP